MADYGLELRNYDGDLMVDSDYVTFTLIHAERVTYSAATLTSNFYTNPGTCTFSAKFNKAVADNPDCIVAFRCLDSWITNTNMTSTTSSRSAEVYVFAPFVNLIAHSEYGLAVYDSGGRHVFDSRAAPLRILHVAKLSPTQMTWEYQADTSLSVAVVLSDLSEFRLNSGSAQTPTHLRFSKRQMYLSASNKVTVSVRPYSVTFFSPPQPNPLYSGFNAIPNVMVVDVTGLSNYIGTF